MRRATCLAILAASTTLPAKAEEQSLWSLLHPDRIAGQLLRSGIMTARSYLDVTYSNLTVSMGSGVVSMDDVGLVLYDNITGGDVCDISIEGVELLSGDPFAIDTLEVTLAARGVALTDSCLPDDLRPGLAVIGQDSLYLPEVTLDLTYDMPSGGARLGLSTAVAEVGALRLDVDMAYATVWVGDNSDGEPSGELRSATLSLEDLGGWGKVAPFLPPSFSSPDAAGAAASQMIGQAFEQAAAGQVVPKSAKTFAVEAARAWADFVADPGRLVLETGFDPAEPVFVDPTEFENGLFSAIDILQPVVVAAPRAERMALAPQLVAQALSTPDALSPEERRAVGMALLTGHGAPRAPGLGLGVLSGLALDDDGALALAMARAQQDTAPEEAYALALTAGALAEPGARALLNTLEANLPFSTRLRLQDDAAPEIPAADLSAPTRELAARAEAHLRGVGASRSLRNALLLSTLAAARGHGGAARLLDRIDRMVPADGAATWQAVSDEVADAAVLAWTNPTD